MGGRGPLQLRRQSCGDYGHVLRGSLHVAGQMGRRPQPGLTVLLWSTSQVMCVCLCVFSRVEEVLLEALDDEREQRKKKKSDWRRCVAALRDQVFFDATTTTANALHCLLAQVDLLDTRAAAATKTAWSCC